MSVKMMYLPLEFRMPFRIEISLAHVPRIPQHVDRADGGFQTSQNRQRLVQTPVFDDQDLMVAIDAVEERDELEESLLEVPRRVVAPHHHRQVRGGPAHQR